MMRNRLASENASRLPVTTTSTSREQRRAQTMVVGGEGGQFVPSALGDTWWQVEWGIGRHCTSERDACIVGQADKMEVTAEMAAHHGVQAVDIFGPYLVPHFHADDMALARPTRWQSIASSDPAFLHRGRLALLGALDLATAGEVRRWLPSTRSCLISGRWPPRLLYLSTLTSRGPGSAVFVRCFDFFRLRSPPPAAACDVLDGRSLSSATSSWYISSRAARSSLKTRILIRPWALSAASISLRTPGSAIAANQHDGTGGGPGRGIRGARRGEFN